MGSASEMEYQLLLAYDLHWIDEAFYQSLSQDLVSVRRMINNLIKKLKTDQSETKNQEPITKN
jgi:four helix bundle protein